MTQAPTPGPLSAEDVNLLVKGDLLRVICDTLIGEPSLRIPKGTVVEFEASEQGLVGVQGDFWGHHAFAFIGRPDADGWMSWSGGENPVPGQRVVLRLRSGITSGVLASEEAAWDRSRIIAFRLAPTAPVEASGSELDETVTEVAVSTIRWAMGRGDDLRDYKEPLEHVLTAALRPQPSGETRPTDEEIRSAIKATEYKYFGDYEFTEDQHAAVDVLVRAAQVLLSARPLASGGQHSGGEWRCEDCGAQADEWFDCCKNPARAGAQDEGAAGSFEERVIMLTKKHGNPVGTDYEQGQNDMGYRMVTMARDADAALAAARAHPSPPPAADEDRVRSALTDLVTWFDKPVQGERGMVWVIRAGDQGADDAVAEALAALKSEGK